MIYDLEFGFGIWVIYEIWNLGIETWILEFGHLDLEFGSWGLAFGIG